jgi:uroporphyrinogen-III synthase
MYPTIQVGPPPSWQPLDDSIARLANYDWLIFTSATVVRFFCERWPADFDRRLSRPLIAAVGGETARALKAAGFSVALVPDDQRQEGLVAALADLPAGSRLLFPRALGGRDHLITALADKGIAVDLVPASVTTAIAPLPPLPAFDVATFASPSALDAFLDGLGPQPLARGAVVVGATTAAAAQRQGVKAVVARAPTAAAVIEAIANLLGQTSSGG